MMKLTNILLEALNVYSMDVLIKTNRSESKVNIYNQIRALKGVVVVTVEQSPYLDSQATEKHEYSLLHIKYMVTSTPEEDIKRIKTDALVTTRIFGLLQFIPRFQTSRKIGKY